MLPLLRKPLFWLAGQAVVLAAVLALVGAFQPADQPDTASYVQFPFHSVKEALNHTRTFVYPAFLNCAGRIAGSYRAVPLCHYLVHSAAVLLFYVSLRSVLLRPWARVVVASSLLYSNVVFRYVSTLTADLLATSLAVVTISLLMMVASRPRSPLLWTCLTASLFAAYQTRPAYLFLPLLAPIVGLSIKALLDARREQPRPWRGMAVGLCAAGILPLLAFCLFRWMLVGSFALVSFGGHNFAGLAGQFLTERLVAELPGELRPLARAALERQRRLPPEGSMRTDKDSLSYAAIESRWDAVTWEVYSPTARRLYGQDNQRVNRKLRELAAAIVRARPGLYGMWLAKAFCQGASLMVAEIVLNPAYLLLLIGLTAAHTWHVAQRLRARIELPDLDADYFTAMNSLLVIAVGFAAAKLLLVIVTTPPQGRFMDAAGVFLPTAAAAALANRLERCLRYRRQADRGSGAASHGAAPPAC